MNSNNKKLEMNKNVFDSVSGASEMSGVNRRECDSTMNEKIEKNSSDTVNSINSPPSNPLIIKASNKQQFANYVLPPLSPLVNNRKNNCSDKHNDCTLPPPSTPTTTSMTSEIQVLSSSSVQPNQNDQNNFTNAINTTNTNNIINTINTNIIINSVTPKDKHYPLLPQNHSSTANNFSCFHHNHCHHPQCCPFQQCCSLHSLHHSFSHHHSTYHSLPNHSNYLNCFSPLQPFKPLSHFPHHQQIYIGNNASDNTNNDNINSNNSNNSNIVTTIISSSERTKNNNNHNSSSNNKNHELLLKERHALRLERNRIAAKECRERRKEYITKLETKVGRFEKENEILRKQIHEVKIKIELLEKGMLERKELEQIVKKLQGELHQIKKEQLSDAV